MILVLSSENLRKKSRLPSTSVTFPSTSFILIHLHFTVLHISLHQCCTLFPLARVSDQWESLPFSFRAWITYTAHGFFSPNSFNKNDHILSKDSELTSSSLSHSLFSVISPFLSSFSAFRNSLFLSVVRRISFVRREEQISMGGVVLEGLCTGRENTGIKLHCCKPEASSVAVLTPFKHSSVFWGALNPLKNPNLMSNSHQNTNGCCTFTSPIYYYQLNSFSSPRSQFTWPWICLFCSFVM